MLKKIMLPVVLFFMLMSTCVVVKAAEVEDGGITYYTDVNEKLVELGYPELDTYDSSKLYMSFSVPGNVYVYEFVPKEDFYVYHHVTSSLRYLYFKSYDSFVCYELTNNDSAYSWVVHEALSSEAKYYTSSVYNMLYSDFDVYADSDKTSIFFHQTPHPTPLVLGMEEVVLAEMIQPEAVLKEVIAILPMILACLVGYLALRKALAALQAILYQA